MPSFQHCKAIYYGWLCLKRVVTKQQQTCRSQTHAFSSLMTSTILLILHAGISTVHGFASSHAVHHAAGISAAATLDRPSRCQHLQSYLRQPLLPCIQDHVYNAGCKDLNLLPPAVCLYVTTTAAQQRRQCNADAQPAAGSREPFCCMRRLERLQADRRCHCTALRSDLSGRRNCTVVCQSDQSAVSNDRDSR